MLPVSLNIHEGVKTVLQRVRAGNDNGYGYIYHNTLTLSQIGDPPKSPEEMGAFPFVNLQDGDEDCENQNAGSALQTGGNRQLLHNSFELSLDCFMRAENIKTAQHFMRSDLQAAIGADFTLNGTAFSCVYASSVPFGMNGNAPNCGITVVFKVWYRIFQTNPNLYG